MKPEEIANLINVGETAFAVSQSRFAEIASKEASIRFQLSELDNARSTRANMSDDAIGVEKFVGADLLWSKWIEARKQILNEALALILSQKIAAQANLKKAFGRKEALLQISAKAAAARKIELGRKLD